MSLFLTRRPDITFEQFADYWKNIHWPKVQTVPGVKELSTRYVQQRRIDGVPPGMKQAPFDGVAEGWWPDMESLLKVTTSREWAEIVGKDDENFLDRSKTLILISEEQVDYQK
jgi:uncharacterized protein (TIGR02118 family)